MNFGIGIGTGIEFDYGAGGEEVVVEGVIGDINDDILADINGDVIGAMEK